MTNDIMVIHTYTGLSLSHQLTVWIKSWHSKSPKQPTQTICPLLVSLKLILTMCATRQCGCEKSACKRVICKYSLIDCTVFSIPEAGSFGPLQEVLLMDSSNKNNHDEQSLKIRVSLYCFAVLLRSAHSLRQLSRPPLIVICGFSCRRLRSISSSSIHTVMQFSVLVAFSDLAWQPSWKYANQSKPL